MEQKNEEFLTYLKQQNEAYNAKARAFIKEERNDEAAFLKAKANIYDVYATLFSVSVKQATGDVQKLKEDFTNKTSRVSENWKKSYELAKEHEDAEKILMEETKLATAEDSMVKFHQIFYVPKCEEDTATDSTES